MKSFFRVLNKIEEAVAMLFLAAIVLLVSAAALMRFVGYPLVFSVEIAQLLFVWVCMLGANQALRRDEHVGVDILVRRLSDQCQAGLQLLTYCLVLVVLLLLVIFGIQLTLLNPQRTLGAVELPYALVNMAIPVGAALMMLTLFCKLPAAWQRFRNGHTPA